ncbi:MAG: ankyrin repeat domain-containing protein [Chlamydiales bacterium]
MYKKFKFLLFIIFSLFFLTSYLAGGEPTIQNFLNEYYSSAEKNQKKYTKLLFASEKGYWNIAFKLLENGEDPNYLILDNKTSTPFMFAISHGDTELVKKMIEKGANVNLKSPYGIYHTLMSPLQLNVSTNKDANITKFLCDSGAKFITKPMWNWLYENPLTYTMSNADFQKFKIIADTLSYDELNMLDSFNMNVFSTSIYWYNVPTEKIENSLNIANYLLDRKILIETESSSALACATRMGNMDLMNLFIGFGADINFKPKGKYESDIIHNPLISALNYCITYDTLIKNKDIDLNYLPAKHDPLKLLLEIKVEINFTFPLLKNGYSPLGFALHNNLNDAAELLIAYGADVNMPEGSRKTPLIRAVEAKNSTGVIMLLNAGADPTKKGMGKSSNMQTPIDIAYSLGYNDILNALIESEAKMYD